MKGKAKKRTQRLKLKGMEFFLQIFKFIHNSSLSKITPMLATPNSLQPSELHGYERFLPHYSSYHIVAVIAGMYPLSKMSFLCKSLPEKAVDVLCSPETFLLHLAKAYIFTSAQSCNKWPVVSF